MKLRNKKTGVILEIADNIIVAYSNNEFEYLEPNIEVEDYRPAEPLIKDEKIRKAVRAWAEACDVERCHYDGDGNFATRWHGITLDGSVEQIDEGTYTIAELCGEEE